MIPLKLVEPFAKVACKIMKLCVHFFEFILLKKYQRGHVRCVEL